jgi:hypothetical protein
MLKAVLCVCSLCVVCIPLQRVHKVSKLLQQQAASSLTAQGAAAVAQRQLQTIAAAAAAAGAPAGSQQTAAAAAAAAAAEVVAAAGAGAGRAGAHRLPGAAVPGLGLASLSAGFAGGMGLPAELQQLFSKAAAAAPAAPAAVGGPAVGLGGGAAAAGGGEAGVVAPTAPLEEIGGLGDELEEDLEGFAAAGALNPGLAGGATRCSLSLSLTRTPGSAAGSLPQHATPGTDAATAGAGGAGFGPTPGSAGFTPGMEGYTPGYTPGSGPNPDLPLDADAGDVLQPLDEGNMGQYGQEGAGLGGGDSLLPGGWEGLDGEGKENAPASGKGGSGRMVWPADAETLLEQEAAGERGAVRIDVKALSVRSDVSTPVWWLSSSNPQCKPVPG